MSCLNSYLSQKYIKSANLLNDVVYYFAARMRYFPDLCVISLFFVSLRLCIKNLFYEQVNRGLELYPPV